MCRTLCRTGCGSGGESSPRGRWLGGAGVVAAAPRVGTLAAFRTAAAVDYQELGQGLASIAAVRAPRM